MRWELDGVQYNSSMSSQQNWESLKLSLEESTKKHAPVLKIKITKQNNIPLMKKVIAVIAEKSRDGSYSLKTRHRRTRVFG